MVQGLEKMQEKWHFTIIDMYRDEAFQAISDKDKAIYMADSIHPTQAGYRDWWLVKFETAILPEGTVQ